MLSQKNQAIDIRTKLQISQVGAMFEISVTLAIGLAFDFRAKHSIVIFS